MAFWATRYSAAQTQISHTHILLIKASLNVCFEVRQSVCVCNAHITFWAEESLMHVVFLACISAQFYKFYNHACKKIKILIENIFLYLKFC